MLTQSLLEITKQLAPSVANWPRRQPGILMVDGKELRYGDLHSFYHQSRQIFGERLYDFESKNRAPVILDCGAHIGLASLYFKERYPEAHIRAFEADAALAELFQITSIRYRGDLFQFLSTWAMCLLPMKMQMSERQLERVFRAHVDHCPDFSVQMTFIV